MFAKKMFVAHTETNGTQSRLISRPCPQFPQHTWSTVFDDSSILGTSPLFNFFRQQRSGQKERLPESCFLKTISQNKPSWSSHLGIAERNPTRNHKVEGLIPGLGQWVKDLALL